MVVECSHSIGEVLDEVIDGDLPRRDFAIQPGGLGEPCFASRTVES